MSGNSATSIALSWNATSDNVGVAAHNLYRNGAKVGTTGPTTYAYTYSDLSCGTSYSLALEVYDAAGNTSVKEEATTIRSTAACLVSDTLAPAAPSSVSLVTATTTSVSVSWSAATDNVGVTGYGVYRNGTSAGSTTTRSYTYTGLTCGTTYTLGVDAYDAAANRSGQTSIAGATSACPPPGTVATRYVAIGGSDSNACTQAAPCATFLRAYRVASTGDTVEVAAGSYPAQMMTADSTKTSGAVTFRPALGASVTVNRITLEGASYLTFRDMAISSQIRVWNQDPGTVGTHDVLFETMRAPTFRVIGQVSNITFRGSEFGNTVDNQPQVIKYNQSDPNSSRPFNIMIENNWFHDFTRSGPSVHTECLQILNADTITVRGNRFNVCDGTAAIGVTDGPTDNLTIENNFFGAAGDAYYTLQITKSTRNLVFRNNSLAKAFVFSDTESGGPYLVVGNYGQHACSPGVTYRSNVFQGSTCSSTDLSVTTLRFVNAATVDLHLRTDSEAIDRGDPTSYPPTDIDGDARPRAGAPDAGADEF